MAQKTGNAFAVKRKTFVPLTSNFHKNNIIQQ